MDLETSSPSPKTTTSENIGGLRQLLERTQKEESDRKSKASEVPISTFHSTQKGFEQRKVDSRPINNQHVHTLPFLQNVNAQRCTSSPSGRFLDYIHRLSGRILACADNPKQKAFSGLSVQRSGLAIQGNALRPQHRPKSLHKTSGSCGSGIGHSRHMVPSLLRRPVNSCSIKRSVHSPYTTSSSDPYQLGFSDQQQQVSSNPLTGVHMARNRVGSSFTHSSGNAGEDVVPSSFPGHDSLFSNLHKEGCDAASGFGQLHRPIRPSRQAPLIDHKDYLASLQTGITKHTHTNTIPLEIQTLQVGQPYKNSTEPGVPLPIADNSNRCLSSRLGLPNRSKKVSWGFRQVHEIINQHAGTSDHMVRSVNSPHQKFGYPNHVRQHDGHCSSTARQLTSFSALLSGRTHLEKSSSVQLDFDSFTHRGQIQYPCRSTVKEHDTVIGMVNSASNLQQNSSPQSTPGSRSVCYTSQQQTTSVYSSLSGSGSSSNRCPINTMGTVEPSIPIPSNSVDSKGTSKAYQNIFHQCSSSDTGGANTSMVHGTSIAQSSFDSPGNSTDSGSGGQNGDRPPTNQTSRVEVIKYAYYSRFPRSNRVVDLLANPIRKSSQGDYERKWHCFCSFLRERGIPSNAITLTCVLDFLTHLFYDKKLQPNTIAHYRSALTVPLRLQYNVDLNDPAVATLLKAMSLQRPRVPVAAPAWCLNKVLSYIDSLPKRLKMESLLQKSAFLLLLATGWRISELHACVRDTAFCHISENSTLLIRPHPSFLAKNESTEKRWQHESIKPLLLHDGSPSNLCPVLTLQKYLNATSSNKTGCLFLHHETGKPLTIKQLSISICRIIQQADPSTKAKVHDVRKYAASCSLAETMQTSNMINALRWRSPHTFWKYYMYSTPPLSVAAVLPGNTVQEGSALTSPSHQ